MAAPSSGFCASAIGAVATAAIVLGFPAGILAPWSLLGPALVLIGLGMGMSIPTMVRVMVERVEPHRAGLVGGIVNSTLQVSAAVGVAALGGVFFMVAGTSPDPAKITRAFSITLLGIVVCHLGRACLAAGMGQRRPISLPVR